MHSIIYLKIISFKIFYTLNTSLLIIDFIKKTHYFLNVFVLWHFPLVLSNHFLIPFIITFYIRVGKGKRVFLVTRLFFLQKLKGRRVKLLGKFHLFREF